MRVCDLAEKDVKIGLRVRAWTGHLGTIVSVEIIRNMPHIRTKWDDGVYSIMKPYKDSAAEVIGCIDDYFVISKRKQ